MKSLLETLQLELVEHVVSFLEPRDIASLRLTSRTMEDKASQWSFADLFKHKTVKLTTSSLQEMVQMTSQSHLVCLLEHCTIAGIVRNEMPATDEEADHLRLLAEGFRNLKRRSPNGRLASLRLHVTASVEDADADEGTDSGSDDSNWEPSDPVGSRSWRAVWDVALCTFNVTMAALDGSELLVDEHLDIFGSTKGCSLGCDAFLAFTQGFASTHTFGSLKRLTVSLSAPHISRAETQPEIEYFEAQSCHIRYSTLALQDITQAPRIMPQLESLDFHWYKVPVKNTRSTLRTPSTTLQESLTTLKTCSLRGIHVPANYLLQFLEAVHPPTLTLTDVHLGSETPDPTELGAESHNSMYDSIFNYLTSPDCPITSYHLDDVFIGPDLVHFDVPGNPKFPCKGGILGPSTLTRGPGHVKEAIHYRLATGSTRPLGSAARYRWVRSKYEEFGPPSNGGYDFVKLNSKATPAKAAVSESGSE